VKEGGRIVVHFHWGSVSASRAAELHAKDLAGKVSTVLHRSKKN
jgi:hypothetical protein